MKEYKHYQNKDGKVIIACRGISRPMNQNDPFLDGYWIPLDLNGSEQFVPRPEFEKEYTEVKKPE